jgi:hypothetical protein
MISEGLAWSDDLEVGMISKIRKNSSTKFSSERK